jgi:hypothetical protein
LRNQPSSRSFSVAFTTTFKSPIFRTSEQQCPTLHRFLYPSCRASFAFPGVETRSPPRCPRSPPSTKCALRPPLKYPA